MVISSYFFYKSIKKDDMQEEIFEEIQYISQNNQEDNISKTSKPVQDYINIQKLYEINNDIIAWIKIEDTNIDYPIMQTKNNPNYYLRKNFYKQYSYMGTPYLSENCNINTSNNLIVYGHHITGSKMFGELEKYRKKSFYKNHKTIKLVTLEESREYEIISVFTTIVDTGFKYYNFINANNEKEFNTFVSKCKELSFYSCENDNLYSNKLLTLSTCDYSSENARLVIIAIRKE